jgi:hypothetical protein
MIDGKCVSKLYGFDKDDWPVRFVSVPRRGELVRSRGGRTLTVKNIIHNFGYSNGLESMIYIELDGDEL